MKNHQNQPKCHLRGLLLALPALLAVLPAAVSAGPSGQALAFTCAGCHGTDGSSVGPSMPAIAGMDPEVFVDAMTAYREDERNPSIMNRIAKAYSDEQFKDMGWFFASQRLQVFPQPYDPALAERGAQLHDEYCEKCHENGGRPGDAGTLAGQWIPYLNFTIEDFISGKRKWPRKMKRKVDAAIDAAGDDAIPALVNYYGSYSVSDSDSNFASDSDNNSGRDSDSNADSQPSTDGEEQDHD